MKRMLALGIITIVLLGERAVLNYCSSSTPIALVVESTATNENELLVRQSLEDRLAAQNIPDGNLLGGLTRIAILEEMITAKIKLSREALPQREGYEFYLVSMEHARAIADKTGKQFYFITIDRPSIVGETATILIGVDFVSPRSSKAIKQCCCTGQGQFRRVDGRWRFVKWAEMTCV